MKKEERKTTFPLDSMDVLENILRTIFSILVLFAVTKFIGYRQISQLSFYDYVIGITIGSIAAEMATGLETAWWQTVIPMVLYGLISFLLSLATIKSIKARRFLTGVPVIVIENGKIIRAHLKKVHYDLSDLLCACRAAGYFDINDLQYAVMEHTGKISFLPYADKRPCNPQDLKLTPPDEGLVANLIIDGKVMEGHLKKIGKEEQWLKKQLEQQHVTVSEVLLATWDINETFSVFKQKEKPNTMNVLS